ncbi:MAG: PorP/SprF family type IX secretion system membrane protein [Chitinophagales bacterium]|nr:PorP/SprF family type IX secretion system membrane protein [Chitinophagales bacterium]
MSSFNKVIVFTVVVFAVCSIQKLFAQNEPQFTHYMFNRAIFNPAYAGSADAIEINALHRSQYVNIAATAINTQFFGVNLPIHAASSGVGISVVNDLAGALRSTYVSLQYNYRKKMKWGNISAGVGIGLVQIGLDGKKLRAPDGNYNGGINHSDDYLPTSLQQAVAPDFSVGIYFNNKNWFAGVAVNHIAASVAKFQSGLKLNYARNILVSGGYDFNVSKKFSLMPSLFLKSDFKKVQMDVALHATIARNFLSGISFRGYNGNSIDAVAPFVGFTYKGFRLVYSYDINISTLKSFNSGSHEVSAAYIISYVKKERKPLIYHNPRFL